MPKPEGLNWLYAVPAAAAYISEQSVEEATAESRRVLEADGWHWFGDTTVSYFMRKEGIRLQVMVTAAPAQGNKTVLQYTAEQLSSALPVPENSKGSVIPITRW
ncbi:MAG: hypothetical protein R3C11_28745 [Planctomycetaceae bacterium]